jgi:hypothetical protein
MGLPMSAIPQASLKKFPFTERLPLIDKLIDPTYLRIKRIAIALFAVIFVIPLVITLTALVLDGFYFLALCLYPNLRVDRVANQASASDAAPEDPIGPVGISLEIPAEELAQQLAVDPIEPFRRVERIAQVAEQRLSPASASQSVVLVKNEALLQEVNKQLNQAICQLRDKPSVERHWLISNADKNWNLNGLQCSNLLEQFEEYIPHLIHLPIDQRGNAQIILKINEVHTPFEAGQIFVQLKNILATLPTQIQADQKPLLKPATPLEHQQIPSIAIPGQIAAPQLKKAEGNLPPFYPPSASAIPANQPGLQRRLQHNSEATSSSSATESFPDGALVDDFEVDDSEFNHCESDDSEEIAQFQKTRFGAALDKLGNGFLDSGNLDKGKKYAYSLHATRHALDSQFQDWEKLLPKLKLQAEESLFADKAYQILHALKNSSKSNLPIREQYQLIVKNLREALQIEELLSTEELKLAHQILLKLCHFKFTQVGMYPFFEDFISKALRSAQKFGDSYQLPKLSLQNLASSILFANRRLSSVLPEYCQRKAAKEFKKLEGTLGFGFDPTADSNTPWVHSIQTIQTEQGSKTRTVLRHGTPTQDPSFLGSLHRETKNCIEAILPSLNAYLPTPKGATVIPEYKAHLRSDPEKISLYVNHQEHDESEEKSIHGEIDRSKAIQSLEEEYRNFHFLALPLDGPIWKNDYLKSVSIDALKETVISSLNAQSNGFALPKSLHQLEGFDRLPLKQIIDRVHELYFHNDVLSTEAEKKTFLMLFYSELKDHISNQLNVDFLVSACKDNKDRGNASTTVDMMKNLVKLGKEHDPEALRELFFSVLGPFIIKNEPIIEERLELALLVINHFSTMSDAQKKTIRKTAMITAQDVPKESASWVQMVGRKPFIEMIRGMRARKEKQITRKENFDVAIWNAFKKDKLWKPNALKEQITKDLARGFYIELNGERITNFPHLCKQLNISSSLFEKKILDKEVTERNTNAMRFMTLLQQGAIADVFSHASTYLNGNNAEFMVFQKDQDPKDENSGGPTKIVAVVDFEKKILNYTLEQKLALTYVENKKIYYPILAKVLVNKHFEAELSWSFV